MGDSVRAAYEADEVARDRKDLADIMAIMQRMKPMDLVQLRRDLKWLYDWQQRSMLTVQDRIIIQRIASFFGGKA
jgi:hypothetical protein